MIRFCRAGEPPSILCLKMPAPGTPHLAIKSHAGQPQQNTVYKKQLAGRQTFALLHGSRRGRSLGVTCLEMPPCPSPSHQGCWRMLSLARLPSPQPCPSHGATFSYRETGKCSPPVTCSSPGSAKSWEAPRRPENLSHPPVTATLGADLVLKAAGQRGGAAGLKSSSPPEISSLCILSPPNTSLPTWAPDIPSQRQPQAPKKQHSCQKPMISSPSLAKHPKTAARGRE